MSHELIEPVFEAQPYELKAVAVMIFLANRQPTVKLPPDQMRAAEQLALAIKNGNKAKALQLASDFYKVLMSPEQIYSAYRYILALNLHGNPDYQIVIDSLKDSYGQLDVKIDTGISLETALATLLLAITYSDKNSISYTRIDEQTGKARPTTFPLTEKLINNFLEPFQHSAGDLKYLVKRVLVFAKSNVVGNPAAEIAYPYQQRKQAYEKAKAAYQQALAEQQSQKPKSIELPKIGIKSGNDVELLTQEFDKILEFVKEAQAQQAVACSFQSKQLKALLKVTQTQDSDFGAKLAAMYSQQLSPQKSQELSARLASRMKRMLSKMGNWKEEYWKDYQTALQQLGVWEGEDWLNKWRDHKSGKQVIAKTGKDYLVEEKQTTVDDLLGQADKIKDKLKGKKMLSTEVDLLDWMKREPSKAPPEQQKVLDALSRSDRLDELIDLALEPEFWAGIPGSLQLKTYQVFTQFSQTDLDTIKAEMLKDIDPSGMEQAKQLLVSLELQINKIAALFKKDFKLSYAQTLEILKKQKEDLLQREKLNSKEYLNSPAAQYSRYQQS